MTSQTFIRIGSIALVGAGALAVAYGLIAPDETAAGVFQRPTYVIANGLNTARWMLMVFGVAAIYLRQGHRSRWLNVAALVLALAAMVLTVGLDIDKTFILPYLASASPGITSMADFAQNMPAGLRPYLAVLMTGLLLHLVGIIVLGIATIRSAVLPVGAGWLLIAGTLLSYGSLFGVNVLHTVGVIGVGIAVAWLGVALWSPQAETHAAMQPLLAK